MEMSNSTKSNIVLNVDGLSKSYGEVKAIRSLSFTSEKGEIFGIIGPDGAGKTTLFRILTTLILADKGSATIEGMDVVKDYKQIRQHIGYMPGKFSLYQDMTVEENLKFFATLFGTTIEDNYDLIKDIYKQIEPFKNRRAGKLSGGMKQKLALSCALIHRPNVLFLDEPTTGVDPVSRKEFWDILLRLKKEGITIIVSTPYMDEASRCDRIALIQDGSFLDIDTPKGIIAKFKQELFSVRTDNMHKLLKDLKCYEDISTSYSFGKDYHVTFINSVDEKRFINYLSQRGHSDIYFKNISPNVEDCFMLLSRKIQP